MVATLPLLFLILHLITAISALPHTPTPTPALAPTPTIEETIRIYLALNRLRNHAITPLPTLPPLPSITPLSIPSYTAFPAVPLMVAHALEPALHKLITLNPPPRTRYVQPPFPDTKFAPHQTPHTIDVYPPSSDPSYFPHYPRLPLPPSHPNHLGHELPPPGSIYPGFLHDPSPPPTSTTITTIANKGAIHYSRPHITHYSYIRRPTTTKTPKRPKRKEPAESDEEWLP